MHCVQRPPGNFDNLATFVYRIAGVFDQGKAVGQLFFALEMLWSKEYEVDFKVDDRNPYYLTHPDNPVNPAQCFA